MSPQAARFPKNSPLNATSRPAVADEAALVRRAQGGDRAAFGSLVERYGAQLVFALEGKMTDLDGARDVAQEAWVRVARGLGGFHVGQRFRPWLFATAFNVLRDQHRKWGLRAEAGAAPMAAFAGELGHASEELYAVDEQEAIALALAEVEEPFQSALRLVDVLGFDYADAAKSLDCAEGTVKSRLSRGRKAFREAYERLVGECEVRGTTNVDPSTQVTL